MDENEIVVIKITINDIFRVKRKDLGLLWNEVCKAYNPWTITASPMLSNTITIDPKAYWGSGTAISAERISAGAMSTGTLYTKDSYTTTIASSSSVTH